MSERRKHQCHKDGCDSAARWSTRVEFTTEGQGVAIPFKGDLAIKVCDAHRSAVLPYLLTDRNKVMMLAWFVDQNMPLPDFDSLAVHFDPFGRSILEVRAPALVH